MADLALQFAQCGCTVFALTSTYMAMVSRSPRAHRWAPVVGLASQPCWAAYAWCLGPKAGWALWAMVAAFSAVYARGCWVQWRAR